jgi:HAD domain in Swiss Army Knife RNA repair proteins
MSERCNAPADEVSGRQVLFVDYDGSLHRFGAYRTRGGIVSSSPATVELFEFAPLLAELLEPYPQVEIVLSTSWVRVLGFRRAKAALPLESLRQRVAGATFHSKFHDAWAWPTIGRGIQILRYVHVHSLVRWLAIDDEDDGFDEHIEHLVKCDERLALGDYNTLQTLRHRLTEQFGDHANRRDTRPSR